jgi:SAM-dependent methyltransferase
MNPTWPGEILNAGFKGADALLVAYFKIIQRYAPRTVKKPNPAEDNQLRDIYRLKTSGRLLDVGCALGSFLRKAEYFYDVEGVEANPHTAALAQKRFTVHQGLLAELNLPRAYDIVTLNQILYGVPDPAGLLRQIHRILKDDGLLYINTPNADSYAMRLYKGRCNHLYGYTTQNVFNQKSLAFLARKTGFRLISFRTEWLDIYTPDLLEYLESPDTFIHKRNTHRPHYEQLIEKEDAFHATYYPQLGRRGNYLVAVLARH